MDTISVSFNALSFAKKDRIRSACTNKKGIRGGIGFTLFFILAFINSYSQEYTRETACYDLSGSTVEAVFPASSLKFGNLTGIRSAKVRIQVDMNASQTSYVFGAGGEYSFEYELSFGLEALDKNSVPVNGVFDNTNYTLRINNNSPVKVWTKDLSAFIDKQNIADSNPVSNDRLQISAIRVTNPQLQVIANGELQTNVRSFIELMVEYAPDVRAHNTLLPAPESLQVQLIDKTAEFKWQNPYPFTLYQLQLLRLYNTNIENKEPEIIETVIDWSHAINIDIPVNEVFDENGNIIDQHDFSLTLGEGTGFYAWRIRPVGTYYEGGITDSRNYGNWSRFEDKTLITLDRSSLLTTNYFYFDDPDEDKNSIYTRVFAEENKIKEVSTYADGLSQVKQTKTYLPTNNVTITAQTVTDYLGRAVINTLPMPTEGKVDNYSKDFFTSGQKLYSAENFENKASADSADEAREMNYYKNNPDPRIADAEGIPFTQIAYYDDPLNRVREEGGPGSTHRIRQDGSGKNTKYFYGTPSETELVRVFGKEAPNNHTVNKMVKVDPNNIATITYTSSDGKILATCLSFYDADNGELVPVSNTAPVEVTNEITKNLKTEWGFVSSKRIILLQQTDLKIDYSVKEAVLKANCANLTFDCDYKLDIIVHDVNRGTDTFLLRDHPLSEEVSSGGVISIEQISTSFGPGTYVIEKRLKPGNAGVDIENNSRGMIEPLVNLISGWLDKVSCEAMVDDFQDKLRTLHNALNNRDLGSVPDLPQEVYTFITNVYNKPLPEGDGFYKDHYSLELFKWNTVTKEYIECGPADYADLAYLRSLCCEITVPVKWVRKFNFRAMPQLAGDMTEIIPDFEGYAAGFFEDCDELNDFKFYKYMEGWGKPGDGVPRGTFNLMVYHMLMDKPDPRYTNNAFIDQQIAEGNITVSPDKPELDDCGNVISEDWQNGLYTIKGLFECWQSLLGTLKSTAGCTDIVLNFPPGNTDIANSIDSQNGGKTFNESINDGLQDLKKRRKKKVTKKLNKKLKNLKLDGSSDEEGSELGNEPIYQPHLVKDFLDCSGYSFVKILTPYNSRPLSEDDATPADFSLPYRQVAGPEDGLPEYFKYKMPDNVTTTNYFHTSSFKKPGLTDYYYYPISDWAPVKRKSDGTPVPGKFLFKGIRNPVYAFKYFEYPQEGWKAYQELEVKHNYDDPNDCFLIENGFIKENADGSFAKGPCCVSSTDPADYSFCYSDYNYPNLDSVYLSNDPRFGQDGNGKFKLLVNDFDGEGRIKIAYDHHSWSVGQRYTFYKALSTFVEPEQEEWRPPYNRTCDITETPTRWYFNNDEESENDLPDIITEAEADLFDINGEEYTDFPRLDNTDPDRLVSEVEMDMAIIINTCLKRCESLVPEFRQAINKTLTENCYDVGGCLGGGIGTPYENVVPFEDIEVMVASLVNTCKSQCQLNTFACVEIGSRDISAPRTITGPTHVASKLMYGMGGFPQEYVNCEEPLAPVYNDAQYYDLTFTDNIPNVDIYKCKMDKDGVTEDSYSWYQYTMINQASGWSFELNLPSKCETVVLQAEDATEKHNCTATISGVKEFGNGDLIRFGKVDFGRGTVSGVLAIAVPPGLGGQNIEVWIEDENSNRTIIGTLTTESTGSEFSYREQNIPFNQTVTGVHDLLLIGSGPGAYIAHIDHLLLKANPGTMSNMRAYSGCTTSTYMGPSGFEKTSDGPPDASGIVTGTPVTSPTITINATATGN